MVAYKRTTLSIGLKIIMNIDSLYTLNWKNEQQKKQNKRLSVDKKIRLENIS